ncbi:MAG TPA: SPOR domain-containing protein [bacterium (Candidatus Stahlbacteria)]|nr:SPOR domain-containing protein [Candidatus Stahlbacteria bacterium]
MEGIVRILLLVGTFLALSCIPRKIPKAQVEAPPETVSVITIEETLRVPPETIFITKPETVFVTKVGTVTVAKPVTERVAPPKEVANYRVQIAACLEKTSAAYLARKVKRQTGENAYVDYVSPYYKVRVGDCVSQHEAVLLRDRLRRLGYSDAWIVRLR